MSRVNSIIVVMVIFGAGIASADDSCVRYEAMFDEPDSEIANEPAYLACMEKWHAAVSSVETDGMPSDHPSVEGDGGAENYLVPLRLRNPL